MTHTVSEKSLQSRKTVTVTSPFGFQETYAIIRFYTAELNY